MSQSQENLWADGRRDYFKGPFWPRPGIHNLSSASDWWEYTKSRFEENARIFSKNSTTQEHITILRLK